MNAATVEITATARIGVNAATVETTATAELLLDAWTETIGRFLIGVARTVRTVETFLAITEIIIFGFAILPISLEIRLLEFVGPEIMNLDFVG